jgi:hypothetical protein
MRNVTQTTSVNCAGALINPVVEDENAMEIASVVLIISVIAVGEQVNLAALPLSPNVNLLFVV